MALVIRCGVNTATWRDHRLYNCGDIADGVLARCGSDENVGSRTGIDRRFAHATKRQPDIGAFIPLPKRHHCCHTRDRKIAAPARDLHEAAAGARLRQRQFDFHQHFVGLQIRRQRAHKKVRGLDPSLLCRRPNVEPGAQGQGDRGELRGRIGVRKIAANRTAISDLRMCDMGQRFADQGKQARKSRIALQRPVPRQGADPGRRGRRTNAGKIPDLVDVDQDSGSSQAKIHRWYQALSAGQKFRVVAMFGLERERVLEGGGGYVFERGRLHGARVRAIETQLHATGETLLRKYEATPGASQKIEARFWLSENPIGACLTPMVVLAH